MSGFSADWLALREPADHRARNAEVQSALAARLAMRPSVRVIDLGSGTGSNLRATSRLLPARQSWTLVDHDAALLRAAREVLATWADSAVPDDGGGLRLTHEGRDITVAFKVADLESELEDVIAAGADLVTAAALFDLASPAFIARTVKAVAAQGAMFYTALTYNGRQLWQPRHPLDSQMTAAFNRHQMTDKGFGASAGPTAPIELGEQFQLAGYGVIEGDSPWLLAAPRDRTLLAELVAGHAQAVGETGVVARGDIDRWAALERKAADIGHVDTFAFPASDARDWPVE
ncbi:MAG: class I SAM-dependent methyltransferase [Hyphomicrobiaceae bacterium]|nr:class I SAM-dependent methyltransferase [Hyphomicrobiaceae bacterium]